MRVAFSGYYGMDNFGDDLFAQACLSQVNRWVGFERAQIVSKPIPGVSGSFSCPEFLAPVYGRHGAGGAVLRMVLQLAERARSDLYVHGGGSLFKRLTSSRALGATAGRMLRRKEAAIGVSLGPFSCVSDERAVSNHLRAFEYLSVRDQRSYDWAIEQQFDFPVGMFGDLVGVMDFPHSGPKTRSPTLGVSLCQFGGFQLGDNSAPAQLYSNLIDAVAGSCAARSTSVKIFQLNGHQTVGDQQLSLALAEALERRAVKFEMRSRERLSSAQLASEIASCDAVISGRLHGAIVAFLSDVPFSLIEYEDKCTSFLDDIVQSPSLRMTGEGSSKREIEAIIESLLDCPKAPAMDRANYRARSQLHFGEAPWADLPTGVEA